MKRNKNTAAGNPPAAKKRKSLNSLVYNNKVVMLISLVLAFGIWIWVAIEKSPVVEATISSVPVQINMENSVPAQLNLQTFGQTEFYVDVTVSGKRFIVSTIKPEDITVVAQTNYVNSAGTKSLQLKASVNNSKDFEITGLSQNYIDVYFDTYKEAEFAVTPRITAPNDQTVIDGCILGDVVFSQNTVVVSGPSTEVNKVTGVVAETTISSPLSATTTTQPEIKLQTEGNETLSNVQIDTGDTAITMTMPVLKKVVLPTTVTFKNAPAGYLNENVPVTVSPSQVEAAVPVEKINEITSISVGTVDFSELDAGYNVFNFKASDITEYTITNSKTRFKVTINMSGKTSATFTVPAENISISAQKDGFSSVVIPSSITNVRVVGTPDEIAALTNAMLCVELDLKDYDVQVGEQMVDANVVIKGNTKAWATGTYSVRINSVTAPAS